MYIKTYSGCFRSQKYFSIIVCKVPCSRHRPILGRAPRPSSRPGCCQSAATLAMVPTNILILHTLLLAACWGKLLIWLYVSQVLVLHKCLEVMSKILIDRTVVNRMIYRYCYLLFLEPYLHSEFGKKVLIQKFAVIVSAS